jgi:alpha-tubulin suppressor-like RCC1 family protein
MKRPSLSPAGFFCVALATFAVTGCGGGTTTVGVFPSADAGTTPVEGDQPDAVDSAVASANDAGPKAPVPLHVSSLAAGGDHACALLSDGRVKCWGRNDHGQLGDGTKVDSMSPVVVAGLSGPAKSLFLGGVHSCAILESGKLACWGSNEGGVMGNGSSDETQAVLISGLSSSVVMGAAQGEQTCALLDTGAVQCWGSNSHGQLGDGTTISSSAPVTVKGLSNAKSISLGGGRACATLASGSVQCWGLNDAGQVGDDTKIDRTTPVEVFSSAQAKAVSVGWLHTCVLLGDVVQCRGYNGWGELGDGTFDDKWSWSAASSVSSLGADARAMYASLYHSCAIRASSGGAVCWGGNNWGQVGDGTQENRSVARAVIGLASGVVSLAVGVSSNCALMTGGVVQCWGANHHGQLGAPSADTCGTGQDAIACSTKPLVVHALP